MTDEYAAPEVIDMGSIHELTLSKIHKTSGSGDVVVINGSSTPIPGGGVIGSS